MTTATSGFYVPPRVAESYVKTKRTETGEFQYDSALQDIGRTPCCLTAIILQIPFFESTIIPAIRA